MLRAMFQKTLDLGHSSQGMWAFRNPHTIKFGIVYGDDRNRCLRMERVSQAQRNDWPDFWCLYSNHYDVTAPDPWA